MKTKYQKKLIFDNCSGDYQIIAIAAGERLLDHISYKYDKIMDPDRGTIEISGDTDDIPLFLVLESDYSLSWEEKQKWEPDND
jgi:hypothetical protein